MSIAIRQDQRPLYGCLCQKIWLWSANYDIEFQFVHISDKTNVMADVLSRCDQSVDKDK